MKRRAPIALAAALALAAPAAAQGPFGPLNDLAAIGEGEGQLPARVPTQRNPEPKLEPVPRAKCRAGDRTEPGIQGRVPAGAAAKGLHCNVDLLSHQGNSGGFKVLRYVDAKGRECAYYDTSLLVPLSAIRFDFDSPGVAVLDMSDPAKPVQTTMLTQPPMLSPHESLVLNRRRGLIAAVQGNPATAPGTVSIYDASQDCRNPTLRFTGPLARLGHESGFSADGRTFYATATGAKSITAIDVSDPAAPHVVWQGQLLSHGLSLSPDGNRAYVASATEGEMVILDTSEIQARKPNPQVREISRLTWQRASIPQNAIPFTKRGHPYVLEIDEYSAGASGGNPDDIGAARIIDIGDERKPRVIAHLRLAVNQPKEHAETRDDPGARSPVQGYAAHYCDLPTRVNPRVVACSFIASGLRVFDITRIRRPREIAYFVAPTQARPENGGQPSNFAMSQPAIVPKRREVWYSDGTTGFYALRVARSAWPKAGKPKRCKQRRAKARRRCRAARKRG